MKWTQINRVKQNNEIKETPETLIQQCFGSFHILEQSFKEFYNSVPETSE